ncbi:hypothetical protein [Sphingomonas hankookensis]|uniref:hypothetical protein n=1 Tax=Sphingomonas hankookensis TaxID=563996 RepID=UPI0026AC82BA
MLTLMLLSLAGIAVPAQSENTTAKSGDTAATTAAAAPKMICRRTLDTGSNVRGKKVCLTARQWDQVSRSGQEVGRSMLPALVTPNQ